MSKASITVGPVADESYIKKPVIAHISDLHFQIFLTRLLLFPWRKSQDSDASAALSLDLLNDPKPDFIIVTGDLTQWGTRWELRKTKDFLKETVEQLKSKREHSSRYILVPGNHDVGIFKRLRTWSSVFENWGAASSNTNKPADLFNYFKKEADDKKARKLADEATRFCEYYPLFQVAFLKFNSNVLPGGWLPSYARGRVGPKQLRDMLKIIKTYEMAFPEFRDSRKIALLHHHVQYLPNTGSDGPLLMHDAGNFWKSMLDIGVGLILHGHKHYASQMVLKYIESGEERETMIVSAGSTTSTDQPRGQRCSYYKIICDHFKYIVQKYQFDGTCFTSAADPAIEYYHIPKFHIPTTTARVDTHALELMLVPEDDEVDLHHRYTRIKCKATIDKELNYVGSYTFTGVNESEQVSSHLVLPLVVVGAHDLQDLKPKAYDLKKGGVLSDPTILSPSSHVTKFKLRISMPPLSKGGDFNVRVNFCLPKVMYRKNDFDVIGLTRFHRGVCEFEYVVRTPYVPVEPHFYSIHRYTLKDLGAMEIKKKLGIYILRKKLKNPPGLGLLFHYLSLDEP